ncbi:alpha/beta fold hydrolase [Halocalculus aciditolerans]|uniref:AB hydrolase-1 domain-containing protein n=1 Tax=Halocalculus aciditolerans TaxID=1383812 RepID=A0A830FFU4_9EURY|nr:alpha/beta hydrolase [Halocalculus aciditolerans]GGL70374.1 hypothetical protein GCM10009039_30540 [Halocalculus aciditolerans]
MTERGVSTVTVEEGRSVAYAEYGDPDGPVVFFCHGTPGSRLAGELVDEDARAAGVRVVAPDRPGVGASDAASRSRRIADWATDVAALADHVGADTYRVLGVSGGGPFALACAARTPSRVEEAAVVSGLGPPGAPGDDHTLGDRVLFAAGRISPLAARLPAWALARGLAAVEDVESLVSDPPEPDQRLLAGEVGAAVLADAQEAFADGSAGVARDYALLASDWGFSLDAITVPVAVYHGVEDGNVPYAHGEYVADRVPEATLTTYEEKGHVAGIVEGTAAALDRMSG